ncbi:MAG: hypothetical protein JWO36_3266 [Myxococcales bacterium]|nr:hypothetical protein [Myxococcales bacterium]
MTATLLAAAVTTLFASIGGSRICSSFAAYVVAFLFARALCATGVAPVLAYQLVVIAGLIDGSLLWSQLRSHGGVEWGTETETPIEMKLAS